MESILEENLIKCNFDKQEINLAVTVEDVT